MHLLPKSLSAFALTALLIPFAASAADAPTPQLAGSPQLYAVRGHVDLGRPTRYATFKTVNGINARMLVVTVAGSSGRTLNADDGSRARTRTCFRSAMQPYQRTPSPRRLKPGVAYKVSFYVRPSLNGNRPLFATRTVRARSFHPKSGAIAPSPCVT
jgi:hypothetical protein